MIVLHLVSTLDPAVGGVSQAVRTMIRGLAELNLRNEVATVDLPTAGYLAGETFKTYAMGPAKTPWAYSKNLHLWLQKNLERYEAVIIHGLWQYQSHCAFKVWKSLNKKPRLFVMPHGMLDPYFQKAKGRKLKAIRNQLIWHLVEKHLVNNSNGLLFTCETEKILARVPFQPYNPISEKVVGLGVEPPPRYNIAMKSSFEKRLGGNVNNYLLFISRIHEKKGVDLLIRAYISLKSTNPLLADLVIAGPGLDTEYGKQMQQLAGTTKGIHFPGMLTGDAKWGAFYGCDAFILPSHQENFGIAVVEALSCGKAVLISDQVNIWREIQEGGSGIVQPDTEQGTFEMLRIWNDLPHGKKLEMQSKAGSTYIIYFSMPEASRKMAAAIKY
jgi:glycosyltransferase involved in cell wall biosynthesis